MTTRLPVTLQSGTPLRDTLNLRRLRGQALLTPREREILNHRVPGHLDLSGNDPLLRALRELRNIQRGQTPRPETLSGLIRHANHIALDTEQSIINWLMVGAQLKLGRNDPDAHLAQALNRIGEEVDHLTRQHPSSDNPRALVFRQYHHIWNERLVPDLPVPLSEDERLLWLRHLPWHSPRAALIAGRPVATQVPGDVQSPDQRRRVILGVLEQLWAEGLPELTPHQLAFDPAQDSYRDRYGLVGESPDMADLPAWLSRVARPADPWTWTGALHHDIWDIHLMIGCSAWGIDHLGLLQILSDEARTALREHDQRRRARTDPELSDLADSFIARREADHHWSAP